MSIEKINKKDWVTFLDQFNKSHRNWFFSIEQLGKGGNIKVYVKNVKLREITVKQVNGINNNFSIIVGDNLGDEVQHLVPMVKKLSVERNNGIGIVLYIEPENEPSIVARFRSPVPTEMLNRRYSST